MNLFYDFLIIALTAFILHNAVFTRGLGSSKETLMLSSPRKILLFGGTLTFITVVSSLFAWLINFLLKRVDTVISQRSLRYFVALACICIVFILLYLLTRAFAPRLHYYLRGIITTATFNCAALGTILIAFSSLLGLLETVGFALGSGLGYTAALLLIHEGRKRIALCDVPRSFRGLPIMLLYMGILSLAIYGLIGHQLPT